MKRTLATCMALAMVLAGCGRNGAALDAPSAAGVEAAGFEDGQRFTLATYNVRNLFDGQTVKLDGSLRQLKPEEDRKALAKTIRELNADVLALEEIESLPTLKRFRDELLADMGYRHVVLVEGNDNRSIDVAVMSRFAVTNVKSHKDVRFEVPGEKKKDGFCRDLLQTTIRVNGQYVFTLFVAHLKSQLGGDPADVQRFAEARQVQSILREFERRHESANFVLAGDMNETVSDPAVATLLTPTARLGKLIDGLAGLGPDIVTYHKAPYRSRIDHLMVSRRMARELVPGSARVLETPDALIASDHLPAAVSFEARNR